MTTAAQETLRVKLHQTMRKRCASNRTRQRFAQQRRDFAKLREDERMVAKRAISTSYREDHREHVDGILNDVEAAERCGICGSHWSSALQTPRWHNDTLRAIRHRQRSTPGDIFSPVAFIAGLDRIFRMHDFQNRGVAVGVGESTTIMSKFEYADDAALIDADAATATARVTALAAGSITDTAMVISQATSKVMHIHRKTHVSSTTEAEVEVLKLAHKCDACSRTFPTQRGLKIHAARWCDGGATQRSRRGSLADRAVQTEKRRAAEALLSQVYAGNTPLENEYLGRECSVTALTTLMFVNAWPSHKPVS